MLVEWTSFILLFSFAMAIIAFTDQNLPKTQTKPKPLGAFTDGGAALGHGHPGPGHPLGRVFTQERVDFPGHVAGAGHGRGGGFGLLYCPGMGAG